MLESNSMSVGAVILAAGSSSRMGSPKQLLQFQGQSLVRRAAVAALEAGCRPVIIVTGANADLTRRELNGLEVSEVLNTDWETGIASSIRSGIEGLISAHPDVDASVVMLCDQPHVTAEIISTLVAAHRRTRSSIVASMYGESFGVPALFGKEFFAELARLEGMSGAKQVIQCHAPKAHFLPFPSGDVDVDTPEDFSRLTAEQ